MSNIYLITPEIIRQYEDLSIHIKPQRIEGCIKKAQELDLKPFLGYALYNDLLSRFATGNILAETTPQAYRDLYNGCLYTDAAEISINYEGLMPALVYLTLARFTEADAIHYTATGLVYKNQNDVAAVQPPHIIKLVQQQRSIANAYLRNVEKFLQDNRRHFPLWHFSAENAAARQPGPRIRAVDRTNFNGIGTSCTYPNDNFNLY